jgi:transcriptional regulator with XRE-family HTH domain
LITGRQLRAARALLGWEQIELAKRSRVAIGTIRRMESFTGEIGSRTSTLSQVQATLERAGIQFLNDESPGVRVRKK